MGFLGLFDCFKRRSKRKGPAGAAACAIQPSAYQVLPSAAPSPASSASVSPQPAQDNALLPAQPRLISGTDETLPFQQPPAADAVDVGGGELVTISSVAVHWDALPSPTPLARAATPSTSPEAAITAAAGQQGPGESQAVSSTSRLEEGTPLTAGAAADDKENTPAAAAGLQQRSPLSFRHTPGLKSAAIAHDFPTPLQHPGSTTSSASTALVHPGALALTSSPRLQALAPKAVKPLALTPAASACTQSPLCGVTPSASQASCATSELPRFPFLVADTPNGQHTPQVAGVDNKVARYREDRQLAQRLTPFAERVEREVLAEEEFRKRLAGSKRSSLA